MVESICGQNFAYAHEVEEDRQKRLVKLGQREAIFETTCGAEAEQNSSIGASDLISFYS
jgi:hypothetical protein